MGEGTRVSHAKFQVSMSIRSETVVFYKILGVGGGGGAPYYPLSPQSPMRALDPKTCVNKTIFKVVELWAFTIKVLYRQDVHRRG